jgi:hypothetical protein
MRKSRVLLAGVAVAAAAAGTTAFTGSNTFGASVPTVAGYGELAATGATVTNVHYVDTTTPGVVDSVVFTTSTDVTNNTASMSVKNTVAGTETVVGSPYTCAIAGTVGAQTITCATTATTLHYADFDLVALTVSH